MKNMTQFKALVIAAMAQQSAELNTNLRKLLYCNSDNFDYVLFFSHSLIRNIVIPDFDRGLDILCGRISPTTEDNKFLKYTKDGTPTATTIDYDFWSWYVRNHIQKFCRQTWSPRELDWIIRLRRREANQIIRVSRKINQSGFKDLKDMETRIKRDNYPRHEILCSSIFDVKSTYVGESRTRPMHIWSYGSDSWATCMAFLLRMEWNRIVTKRI
jgi:hypothetical protein